MLVSQALYALGTCTSSATACNLLAVLESVLRRELALLRDRRARRLASAHLAARFAGGAATELQQSMQQRCNRLASDHLAARFTGGDMGDAGAGVRLLLHALLQLCCSSVACSCAAIWGMQAQV